MNHSDSTEHLALEGRVIFAERMQHRSGLGLLNGRSICPPATGDEANWAKWAMPCERPITEDRPASLAVRLCTPPTCQSRASKGCNYSQIRSKTRDSKPPRSERTGSRTLTSAGSAYIHKHKVMSKDLTLKSHTACFYRFSREVL